MNGKIESILESIDKNMARVRTKSFDVSFNELLDMYDNSELIIDPEYQRLFRWDQEKQSRFIESLILEMPVPPIYVIEIESGRYELIDGLQRISSYLNFRGKLTIKDRELKKLKLGGCDIISEINGLYYEDLPSTIQIRLKRNFIRLEVLRKESDTRLRYYMFKRLNTGGEILSEQEVRNCTIRLLDSKINDFIIEMSENKDFKNTICKLEAEKIDKKFDQELILRYLTLKNNIDNYFHPFDRYLTEYMERVARKEIQFDYEKEKNNFKKTFKILNNTLGKDIFSTQVNIDSASYENFVIYFFDSFTLGIQKRLIELENIRDFNKIRAEFINLKVKNIIYPFRTGNKGNIKRRKEIVENSLEDIK